MNARITLPLWASLVFITASVFAQGVLIMESKEAVRLPQMEVAILPHPHPMPRPTPGSYKVQGLDVRADVKDQVAQVQVSQTFVNTGAGQVEASFVFPLPDEGAVESMTFMVDGKEYAGKLMDAKEARRIYEEIVRKNRDPALLEWIGSGMFKTSVFPIPPGALRTVLIRYSQLCRQRDGLTDFVFPLSVARFTSEPLEKIAVTVNVESAEPIKNIYSPSHDVKLKRTGEGRATVTYEAKNTTPSTDFRLLFDAGQGGVSARTLSYRPIKLDGVAGSSDRENDGFFMSLVAPQMPKTDAEVAPKNVIFVIDRSGSMGGKKIEQVKAALKNMINRLRPKDTFNVIAFDDVILTFKPTPQAFSEETRDAALGFVENMFARGSTAIDAALSAAFEQAAISWSSSVPLPPSYVLFLTDGLPTAGETNENRIVDRAKSLNKMHARLMVFGVGYDVNSRLLDKLARENYGLTEYVRPDEDIELRVNRLYARIESPVLTGATCRFVFEGMTPAEGDAVSRVYPSGEFDLFAGEQVVFVGRYKKSGPGKLVIEGTLGSAKTKYEFPVNFAEKSADSSCAFVEKLWAVRRVGEILDQIDLKGKNEELVRELVELATRHGIVTPYTSFMADDRTSLTDLRANAAHASERLDAFAATDGKSGFAQRNIKQSLQLAKNYDAPMQTNEKSFAEVSDGAFPALQSPTDGLGFGVGGRTASGAVAGTGLKAAKREFDQSQNAIRQIGLKTFYNREGVWTDPSVTPEQKKQARRVKQFSDEYFKLVDRAGRDLAQYLAVSEPVLFNAEGETYFVEP